MNKDFIIIIITSIYTGPGNKNQKVIYNFSVLSKNCKSLFKLISRDLQLDSTVAPHYLQLP